MRLGDGRWRASGPEKYTFSEPDEQLAVLHFHQWKARRSCTTLGTVQYIRLLLTRWSTCAAERKRPEDPCRRSSLPHWRASRHTSSLITPSTTCAETRAAAPVSRARDEKRAHAAAVAIVSTLRFAVVARALRDAAPRTLRLQCARRCACQSYLEAGITETRSEGRNL